MKVANQDFTWKNTIFKKIIFSGMKTTNRLILIEKGKVQLEKHLTTPPKYIGLPTNPHTSLILHCNPPISIHHQSSVKTSFPRSFQHLTPTPSSNTPISTISTAPDITYSPLLFHPSTFFLFPTGPTPTSLSRVLSLTHNSPTQFSTLLLYTSCSMLFIPLIPAPSFPITPLLIIFF
jgi:hypothetical protein